MSDKLGYIPEKTKDFFVIDHEEVFAEATKVADAIGKQALRMELTFPYIALIVVMSEALHEAGRQLSNGLCPNETFGYCQSGKHCISSNASIKAECWSDMLFSEARSNVKKSLDAETLRRLEKIGL